MSPGSPAYVAPEAATPGLIGPAFDQYSLGVVVYELLSGTLPHAGGTPIEIYIRKARDLPRPLKEVARDIPKPVAAAVMRALSIDPASRFRSCSAFVRAFEQGIGPLPKDADRGARPPTTATVPQVLDPTATLTTDPAPRSHRGALVGVAAGVLAAVIGFIVWWTVFRDRSPAPPDQGALKSPGIVKAETDGATGKTADHATSSGDESGASTETKPSETKPDETKPKEAESTNPPARPEPEPEPPPAPIVAFELLDPADELVSTRASELAISGRVDAGFQGELRAAFAGVATTTTPLRVAAGGLVSAKVALPAAEGEHRLEIRDPSDRVVASRRVVIDRTKPRSRTARVQGEGPFACEDELAIEVELDEPAELLARRAQAPDAPLERVGAIAAGGSPSKVVVRVRPPAVRGVAPKPCQLELVARDRAGNETIVKLPATLFSRAATKRFEELRDARPDRLSGWTALDDAARLPKAAAWQSQVESAPELEAADRAALLTDVEWRRPRPVPEIPPPPPMPIEGRGGLRIPAGFVAVPDATTDAETGLPSRIAHAATGIQLALIPAGSFLLGASDDDRLADACERPARQVTLTRPYYLAVTEVTNEQFRVADSSHICGTFERNPRLPLDALRQPVVNVAFAEAQAYCAKYGFVLPSEAQWERAARGDGPTLPFPWGSLVSTTSPQLNCYDRSLAAYRPSKDAATFDDRAAASRIVGSYAANSFGLYDLNGNVEELCRDLFDRDAYSKIADGAVDPVFTAGGRRHVTRGGGFESAWRYCRSTARGSAGDAGLPTVGFRVALELGH
jgi:formylglycine-generating enzyme required for sulfatase activity